MLFDKRDKLARTAGLNQAEKKLEDVLTYT